MTLDYPWIKITRHKDVTSGLILELPFNRHHVVWNDISADSFQVIVVVLNVMRRVFTGSQFTKTLATVEFDFTKSVVSFEPRWADWKRVKPGTYNRMLLEFHDTCGRPLTKHHPHVGAQSKETTSVVKDPKRW